MSEETLEPPLPPIDARTEAVAERLFGLKFALRKDDPKHIHDEWEHAADWIRDGYLRQAIEVLATADRTQAASADGSDYEERMRVEYRELTARAGRLRDMLQRYADGTLDFEPTCPITLLSRQLDVMDEYALILRRRANIERISLVRQRIDTAVRGSNEWRGRTDPRMEHGNRQTQKKKQRNDEPVKTKKILVDMIMKWHQAGYSTDEIAPLVPQIPKPEIQAIIQHRE